MIQSAYRGLSRTSKSTHLSRVKTVSQATAAPSMALKTKPKSLKLSQSTLRVSGAHTDHRRHHHRARRVEGREESFPSEDGGHQHVQKYRRRYYEGWVTYGNTSRSVRLQIGRRQMARKRHSRAPYQAAAAATTTTTRAMRGRRTIKHACYNMYESLKRSGFICMRLAVHPWRQMGHRRY